VGTPDGNERPLVSVVVPMYNEALVVEKSLTAICAELDSLADRFSFEVLVVDDGSTDTTRDLAIAFAQAHPIVRVLVHQTNFRLGQALRFAFGQSRGDHVIVYDADLSYSPDHIGRLLDAIVATGARVVIASPYMKDGRTYAIPRFRRWLSRGANWFLSLTALDHLTTVTGMVRAYNGPFIRSLTIKAIDVDVNTEIIYKAQVMRALIVEIPAVLDWRGLVGRTRGRGFNSRLYWATAKQLVLGFMFRPFMFFLMPGVLLSTVGLISVVWAFAGHHATTTVMVSSLPLVIGVQLSTLAVFSFQTKRYFEELYYLGTTLRRDLDPEFPVPPARTPSA
jgi:glycosyltransferase involved in cell wall biosynthesis